MSERLVGFPRWANNNPQSDMRVRCIKSLALFLLGKIRALANCDTLPFWRDIKQISPLKWLGFVTSGNLVSYLSLEPTAHLQSDVEFDKHDHLYVRKWFHFGIVYRVVLLGSSLYYRRIIAPFLNQSYRHSRKQITSLSDVFIQVNITR